MPGNEFLYQELLDHALMMSQPLRLKIEAFLSETKSLDLKQSQFKNDLAELKLLCDTSIEEASHLAIAVKNLRKNLIEKHRYYVSAAQQSKTTQLDEAEREFYAEYQKYQKALKLIEKIVTRFFVEFTAPASAETKRYNEQSRFATRILLTDFNPNIPLLDRARRLQDRIQIALPYTPFASEEQKHIPDKFVTPLAVKISLYAESKALSEPLAAELSHAQRLGFEDALLTFYSNGGEDSLNKFGDHESPPNLLIKAKKDLDSAEEKLLEAKSALEAAEAQIQVMMEKNKELHQVGMAQLKIHADMAEKSIQEFKERQEPRKAEYIATKVSQFGEQHRAKITQHFEQHVEVQIKRIAEAANATSEKRNRELQTIYRTREQEIELAITALASLKRNVRKCENAAKEKAAQFKELREPVKKWQTLDQSVFTRVTPEAESSRSPEPHFRRIAEKFIIPDIDQLTALKRDNAIKKQFSIVLKMMKIDEGLKKYYEFILEDYKRQQEIIKQELIKSRSPKSTKELIDAVAKILEYRNMFNIMISEYRVFMIRNFMASKNPNKDEWLEAKIQETLQEKLFSRSLKEQIEFLRMQDVSPTESSRKESKENDLKFLFQQLQEAKPTYREATEQFDKAFELACSKIVAYHLQMLKKTGKLLEFSEKPSPLALSPRGLLRSMSSFRLKSSPASPSPTEAPTLQHSKSFTHREGDEDS